MTIGSVESSLLRTDHRPWPLPPGPWVMAQEWHRLLFAHWPLPPAAMRALVPPQFEVDLYEGCAWLGIVPFVMRNVRPRLLPALPWLSHFPELNVRTYVRMRDRGSEKPGVYFFSLDAANPVAVAIARRTFHLPYFRAHMHQGGDGEQVEYASVRTHPGAPGAAFAGSYRPAGPIVQARPGTQEYWLCERYALYTPGPGGRPYIGEIHHPPWPLQRAEARLETNTMAGAAAVRLPEIAPLLHYAHALPVRVWPLRPVEVG